MDWRLMTPRTDCVNGWKLAGSSLEARWKLAATIPESDRDSRSAIHDGIDDFYETMN
jgi:hypothetical protein